MSPTCALETMRPRPESGLILLNFGSSTCIVNTQPPEPTAAASAASAVTRPKISTIGSTDRPMSCRRSSMRSGDFSVTTSKRSAAAIRSRSRSVTGPMVAAITPSAAAITARWPRSRERGIWPSLRAFSSRLGVAGSCLSCEPSDIVREEAVSEEQDSPFLRRRRTA